MHVMYTQEQVYVCVCEHTRALDPFDLRKNIPVNKRQAATRDRNEWDKNRTVPNSCDDKCANFGFVSLRCATQLVASFI